MRVLCIHPNSDYNIGDLMTLWGTKYLMRRAFDDVEFLQFDTRRAEEEIETYVPQYNWGDDVDVILLAGSPWIGVNGDDPQRRMVFQALERWPRAAKIALGVGSMMSHTRMGEGNFTGVHADFLACFDLVVVRDILAKQILAEQRIDSVLQYDTSIYARFCLQAAEPVPGRAILVYYDPLANDVFAHAPADVWNAHVDYQLAWADSNDADVYVVTSGDKGSLSEKGIPGRFVCDLEWLATRFSTTEKVLSGRVHQAILAKIMGSPQVACLPVDSRFLTVLNIGIEVKQAVSLFSLKYKKLKFRLDRLLDKTYEQGIIRLLREAI